MICCSCKCVAFRGELTGYMIQVVVVRMLYFLLAGGYAKTR